MGRLRRPRRVDDAAWHTARESMTAHRRIARVQPSLFTKDSQQGDLVTDDPTHEQQGLAFFHGDHGRTRIPVQ